MVSWYKHNIPAWLEETDNLSSAEYRVYHVVRDRIYLNDGSVPLNEQSLAGGCNMHILTFRKNLASLIASGKLAVVGGKLSMGADK